MLFVQEEKNSRNEKNELQTFHRLKMPKIHTFKFNKAVPSG